MARITKLTDEQKTLLAPFREQFRAEALRTDSIDEDAAKTAVSRLYTTAGLDEPRLMLIAQSPMQAQMMRSLLSIDQKQLWHQFRGQLWHQLGHQLWHQLWGQLWHQLEDQLRGQLGHQLRGQLGGQLWHQLEDQLRGQLGGQLRGQLRGQLWDQLGVQLGGQLGVQLGHQLRGQLGVQLGVQLKNYGGNYFDGAWDGYWLSFYEFGRRIGVKYDTRTADHLDAYLDYSRQGGVAYLYPSVAIICDRPKAMRFDDQRRLHHDNGPALEWRDGYAIHAWHGTRMPPEWFYNGAPDIATVLSHSNVECRAAGLQYIGLGNPDVLDKLDHEIVDSDPNPERGDLIRLKIPGLSTVATYLRAQCPRNGLIMEAVPPHNDCDENRPITTVKAAQAWRVRMSEAEFTYPSVRT